MKINTTNIKIIVNIVSNYWRQVNLVFIETDIEISYLKNLEYWINDRLHLDDENKTHTDQIKMALIKQNIIPYLNTQFDFRVRFRFL